MLLFVATISIISQGKAETKYKSREKKLINTQPLYPKKSHWPPFSERKNYVTSPPHLIVFAQSLRNPTLQNPLNDTVCQHPTLSKWFLSTIWKSSVTFKVNINCWFVIHSPDFPHSHTEDTIHPADSPDMDVVHTNTRLSYARNHSFHFDGLCVRPILAL